MPRNWPEYVRQWFREQGAAGGRKAAQNMTKQARHERAKKAVQTREANRKKKAAQ